MKKIRYFSFKSMSVSYKRVGKYKHVIRLTNTEYSKK